MIGLVAMNALALRAQIGSTDYFACEVVRAKLRGAPIDEQTWISGLNVIMAVTQEPEPEVPTDQLKALTAAHKALAIWQSTPIIARLDWMHWVTSAKQVKKRVCCFDPSGYYSKAFSVPKRAD